VNFCGNTRHSLNTTYTKAFQLGCWWHAYERCFHMIFTPKNIVHSVVPTKWCLSHISINAYNYKKFWEELVTYFPFTVIWIYDMTSRKKTSVCICNETNKTIQFGRLQCWYYDETDFWSTLLRWPQVAWYTYQVSRRLVLHSGNIKVIISTIWEAAVLLTRPRGFTRHTRGGI
jgi:hypothetical protein